MAVNGIELKISELNALRFVQSDKIDYNHSTSNFQNTLYTINGDVVPFIQPFGTGDSARVQFCTFGDFDLTEGRWVLFASINTTDGEFIESVTITEKTGDFNNGDVRVFEIDYPLVAQGYFFLKIGIRYYDSNLTTILNSATMISEPFLVNDGFKCLPKIQYGNSLNLPVYDMYFSTGIIFQLRADIIMNQLPSVDSMSYENDVHDYVKLSSEFFYKYELISRAVLPVWIVSKLKFALTLDLCYVNYEVMSLTDNDEIEIIEDGYNACAFKFKVMPRNQQMSISADDGTGEQSEVIKDFSNIECQPYTGTNYECPPMDCGISPPLYPSGIPEDSSLFTFFKFGIGMMKITWANFRIEFGKFFQPLDITGQAEDIPEDSSLFSFWKIGIGRAKIAFTDLITKLSNYFQRISSSGGISVPIYLSNSTSGFSGYKKLTNTPDLAETIATITANNNTVLGQSYVYDLPVGVPTISAGAWAFDYWRKISSAANESYFGIDFFMLDPIALTRTALFSLESPSIEDTDYVQRAISYSEQQFTVDPTHHLGCQLKLRTGRHSNTTISYIVGDGHGFWMRTPLTPRHSQLRDINGDPIYQHIDTTTFKTTPVDADSVALYNSVSSKVELTTLPNLKAVLGGGTKKIVQQNTKYELDNLTGMAIKKISNYGTKVCVCSASNTYIHTINSFPVTATLTTTKARLVTYCASIDEFHVICNLDGTIFRVSGTANTLLGTISVSAQTSSDRTAFDNIGNFEYYTSGANGVVLNQRNLTDGTVTTVTLGSNITAIRCFNQSATNYIAIITGSAIIIYNESLQTQSTTSMLTAFGISMCYYANKLYATGSISNFGMSVLDVTTIGSPSLLESTIGGWKAKCTTHGLITESQGLNIQSIGSKNYTLKLHDYNGLSVIDSRYMFPTNYFAIQGLEYDDVNDVVISMAISGGATFYGMIIYSKIV